MTLALICEGCVMNKGTLVFAQLSEHLPKAVFARGVSRYAGSYPALSFSHWDQLLCMLFAQFTSRASLRDITMCLRSHSAKLYRAGFRGGIARSTLADANERRDCRIFEEFALHLIGLARVQYADDSLALELEQTVYAIDATNIDLCLSEFRAVQTPLGDWCERIARHGVHDLHRAHDARLLVLSQDGFAVCLRLISVSNLSVKHSPPK